MLISYDSSESFYLEKKKNHKSYLEIQVNHMNEQDGDKYCLCSKEVFCLEDVSKLLSCC